MSSQVPAFHTTGKTATTCVMVSVFIITMNIYCNIGDQSILLCLQRMTYHNTYWGVNRHPPFCWKTTLQLFSKWKCCLTTWNRFVWLMVPFAWAILITYLQMLIASDVHTETSTTFEFSQSQLGSTATSAKTSCSCAHSKDSCPQTSTEFEFASSTLTASYQHILHSTAAIWTGW